MSTAVPSKPSVEDVWQEAGALLRNFVRRRIADPDQADDVVGDILVRIHQHLDQLDDSEKVVSWMFRIARNAIVDHYRRASRQPEHVDADQLAAEIDGPEGTLDDMDAVLADLACCVRPLVKALPPHYRRALELTDLDGHTQAAAAHLEGISLSGMKSRIQRARRQFAALMRRCCHISLDARGGPLHFQPRAQGPCCTPEGQ